MFRRKAVQHLIMMGCAAAMAGCGGDEGNPKPAGVDVTNTQQAGGAWLKLNGSQREQMVARCKAAAEKTLDPNTARDAAAIKTTDIGARLDEFYAEPGNRAKTIQQACTGEVKAALKGADQANEASDKSCDAKGINAKQLKTGTCEDEGTTFTVVNKDQTLKMEDLDVQYHGFTTAQTVSSEFGDTERASGIFVIVSLTATNKLDSPATIDDGAEQFHLLTDDKRYSQNFDVANGGIDDSCMFKDPQEVQPGLSKTCKVVFDVPPKAADGLAEDGNLLVVETSDVQAGSSGDDVDKLGTIRMYH